MNLLHLRYAVEVEKAGSITQAAENLYMAQPNLSKALRELESDLNIIIFERLPRGVVPTPKGQEFLAHAKRILAEVELMNSLQQENDENTQAFSLSIPRGSYVAEGFLQFVSKLDFANRWKFASKRPIQSRQFIMSPTIVFVLASSVFGQWTNNISWIL